MNKFPISDPLPETKFAIEAAIEAGKVVMEVYNKNFSSSIKSDNEPITEADIKSNNSIKNIISRCGHPILSEESPDDKSRLAHKKIWIVDPLDGTTDFVRKLENLQL